MRNLFNKSISGRISRSFYLRSRQYQKDNLIIKARTGFELRQLIFNTDREPCSPQISLYPEPRGEKTNLRPKVSTPEGWHEWVAKKR